MLDLSFNKLTTKGLKVILRKFQRLEIRSLSFEGNHFEIISLDYLISFRKYNGYFRNYKVGVIRPEFSSRKFEKRLNILKKQNIHVDYKFRSE